MKKAYICSLCGKQNVKLWRPYGHIHPLLCAECAESRQTVKENCKRWSIDNLGNIPKYDNSQTNTYTLTEILFVDLDKLHDSDSTKNIKMVPAIPDELDFWGYIYIPPEEFKWWRNLPTRSEK